MRGRVWGYLLVFLMGVAGGHSALAHPMGNFSINHYGGIHVERDGVELRYIVDFAEIPTYQEIQDAGIVAQVGDASLAPYLVKVGAGWVRGLHVTVNGEPVRLTAVSRSVIFPPGAGGLPTMKIGVVYRGAVRLKGRGGAVRLRYADENYAGHAGWKEIVVTAGKDVALGADPPFGVDRSAQLTNYPTNLLNSPPQDLEAEFGYTVPVLAPPVEAEKVARAKTGVPIRAGAEPPVVAAAAAAPALVLEPNRQATPRSRFTEMMTDRRMSLWFLITGAFLAAGLGALHALEPGHGKTIVAAYLVGSRGRTRHAVGLGLLVTAAHTAGVYLLGAVVLYASKYVIPERIYPWLSIFSGLVIAVLAGYLFLRGWTGNAGGGHEEGAAHTHWYDRRRSAAVSAGVKAGQEGAIPLRQMIVLGITGGIVPCPAALVVLLSAVSLHRVGLGLFLIVAFSVGLAAVLVGIGVGMVRARHLVSRWKSDAPWVQRWVPLISSATMFAAGLAIAVRALPATGLSLHLPSLAGDHLGSFGAIVVVGLLLGVRHSTDPDHVVAVSTIVSRERATSSSGRSVGQGAVIGMMWGLGHTVTIFAVGAAIILFKLTIPPRLGLSMEMAVAGMLILVGLLNLTGVMRRLTERLTPSGWNSGKAEDVAARRHEDDGGLLERMVGRFGVYQLVRPLAIGLVHGLAGSAAVALLVLSMIRSAAWAVAYLVVFGLGTVAGMMLMTTAMAIPVALTGRKFTHTLSVVSGVVSVCFGLFLVYQIGFVDGLFTSHVHWTPE